MNDEITTYVEGVRRSLSGLSETSRDELLEDLPEHLAEVRAEGSGTLVARLGTPEAYASELRASAGLVGGFPEPPPSLAAQWQDARDQAVRFLDRADVKAGPVIGYEKASDFLTLLRPAWWVLRGYLVAMAIAYLLSGGQKVGLLPRLGGSAIVAVVLLAGCVVVSIGLGRRSGSLSRLPRLALASGTAILVIFALAGFVSADGDARNPGYSGVNYDYSDPNPYSNVNDVYVYDGQGRLVENARLYDQDGSPIQLGSNTCTDPETGETQRSRNIGLPYCPQYAPFASASATPTGSASPRASVSPSVSPSGSPSTPAGRTSASPPPSVDPTR